jgi:hypothetical protein
LSWWPRFDYLRRVKMKRHRQLLARVALISSLSTGLCAVFCASAGLCGCGNAEARPVSEYEISGTVTDDLTGAAVGGALVTFVSDTLDETQAHCDGSGRYSMSVQVTEGEHFGTLHASAAGYEDSTPQSVYFDGTARTVDLRLRAKGP